MHLSESYQCEVCDTEISHKHNLAAHQHIRIPVTCGKCFQEKM
jgi:hypothetical protein